LRLTTFGESHGSAVGCIVDGCPADIQLTTLDIQLDLDRRRPGQSNLTTARDEADQVEVLSGVEDGITLGTPIGMLVRNKDARPDDYEAVRTTFRPGHADFTYREKYGQTSKSGGGRASARETIGRVAGGAVAKALLRQKLGVEVQAMVAQVGSIEANLEQGWIDSGAVEASLVRCPDPLAAEEMERAILSAKEDGDSLGGVIECRVKGVPTGLGEPVFDKLEALLAHAILSIPACRGFEIGNGFKAARLKGSENNDVFVSEDNQISTETNRSGGVQGGISNGEVIWFRAGFKPPSTIAKEQRSVTVDGDATTLAAKGRHDPCVLPRAVPIVEAMAALVLADAALIQFSRQSLQSLNNSGTNSPAYGAGGAG
jgi:chorismate synthase